MVEPYPDNLPEFLTEALAENLRVSIPRDEWTDEIRAFVESQPGWIWIGGEEDTHFLVCPPRAPAPQPTEEDFNRWAEFIAPQQRTQEKDPRGFWSNHIPLPRFQELRRGRVSTRVGG